MEDATEARFEAIKITLEGMKAKSAAVRRDLQQIMKILGNPNNQADGSSDDSSVNDNVHQLWEKWAARERRKKRRTEVVEKASRITHL